MPAIVARLGESPLLARERPSRVSSNDPEDGTPPYSPTSPSWPPHQQGGFGRVETPAVTMRRAEIGDQHVDLVGRRRQAGQLIRLSHRRGGWWHQRGGNTPPGRRRSWRAAATRCWSIQSGTTPGQAAAPTATFRPPPAGTANAHRVVAGRPAYNDGSHSHPSATIPNLPLPASRSRRTPARLDSDAGDHGPVEPQHPVPP
jgi:hypothetical protein